MAIINLNIIQKSAKIIQSYLNTASIIFDSTHHYFSVIIISRYLSLITQKKAQNSLSIQQSILLYNRDISMPTTCLICCQQSKYFLLPPCNHKQMCWKCCTMLIEGSTFSCPYCKGTSEGTSCILFVNEQQMNEFTFQQVLKRNPYKSATKSYQYYSSQQVANFIEESTTLNCNLCGSSFNNINIMKKHLNEVHKKQFCDVCLQNRKCLMSEQKLYNEGQLHMHKKKGQYSHQGELILYHPQCYFCKIRFYDNDSFRAHLRISTHLRCHICQKNYPQFKYVYYKDYLQIEKHFYKSHFVCEFGNCVTKKLENVYVSQQMLEQHKARVHSNKNGTKTNRPVTNLLLFKQQTQLQWDKIGKDFAKQFMVSQKQQILKNEEHHDNIIDIRQFYQEEVKEGNKMSLQQIVERLGQFLFRTDFKSQQIRFTCVPLFNPIHMNNIMRPQIQKFIRSIYQPRISEPLIQIFFTRKFDYRSQNDFFNEIRRKMWSFSPISYYYAFPQLIRFYKDTNPSKIAMDKFYGQSLRSLKISNLFIFHKKERYSDILNILAEHIESQIYKLMIEQKIDLNLYITYLRDLNPNFYQAHHEQLFYVQKQKIKNIYHMIQKTKTTQILNLHWLLMLGVSKNSYKAIFDKFYYKPIEEKTKDYEMNEWVKHMSLKQLALIYAYIEICRQAFIDKQLFQRNKENANAVLLGNVLPKIKTCISNKQLSSLRQLQIKATELAAKLNSSYQIKSKKKGNVIDQQDCPSLLDLSGSNSKAENLGENNGFGLPWQNVNINITHNSNIRVNKRNNNNTNNNVEEQQFPQLSTNKKAKNKQNRKQQEQEEFPVLISKQVDNHKQKKQKKIKEEQNLDNIRKYDLFNKKSAFPSQKIAQNYYLSQTNPPISPTKNSQSKISIEEQHPSILQNNKQTKQIDWNNDDWPTLDSSQSANINQHKNVTKNTKKYRQKQKQKEISHDDEQDKEMVRKNKRKKKKPEQQEEDLKQSALNDTVSSVNELGGQVMARKKTKQQLKLQQQQALSFSKKQKNTNNKLKGKNQAELNQQQKQKQKPKQEQLLIPVVFNKKERKNRVRLDMTDSEQQERAKKEQKKRIKEEKHRKFIQQEKFRESLKYNEGFQSLQDKETGDQGNDSIINKLIQQSKKNNQQKAPQIIVKKGKKGKAVLIQRVDFFQCQKR